MAASLPWKTEFASIHCLRLDRFLYSRTRGLRAISCLACTVCPVPLAIFLWLVHRHRFAFPVLFLQHNCRQISLVSRDIKRCTQSRMDTLDGMGMGGTDRGSACLLDEGERSKCFPAPLQFRAARPRNSEFLVKCSRQQACFFCV